MGPTAPATTVRVTRRATHQVTMAVPTRIAANTTPRTKANFDAVWRGRFRRRPAPLNALSSGGRSKKD